MKASIQFQFDQDLLDSLAEWTDYSWPEYISSVFVHAQTRFMNPSLGTQIYFEVINHISFHFSNKIDYILFSCKK